jgi:hypothetical protein
MGAYRTSVLTDGPFQGLSTDGAPLHTAVWNRTAGGLWFDPGAFQHDVMMVLRDPEGGAKPEPNGTSHIVEEPEGLPPDV